MSKKALFIVAQRDFRDEELFVPKSILENRGIKTVISSKTRHKAISSKGDSINPDLALAEINPKDFDVVIFVGGDGSQEYFEDEQALKIAQLFQRLQKPMAAICIAPSILANAGVLMGKEATAFPDQEENLRNKGVDYTGMPIQQDGLIITAKEASFAKKIWRGNS